MSVSRTLQDIESRGVRLWFEADRLRFRAPRGALLPEHRAWLTQHRDEVIAALVGDARQRRAASPLSFGQKALWFIQQQAPASPAYHISVPARVRGALDREAMRNAVQALMDRHPALRTTYAIDGGDLSQTVSGWMPAPFEARPADGMPEDALRLMVEDEVSRPFDLAAGPLLRVGVYTRAPDDHVLVITAHHIAADGWSLLMLFDELTKLYHEFTGGPAAGLVLPQSDYVGYVKWQQDLLEGAEGERLAAYWRKRMAPPRESLDLPVDRPNPPVPTFTGGQVEIPLAKSLQELMRELGARLGVTPFVAWLATFKAFLAQLTGNRDIIVGTPTFGRDRAEFMQIVGNFVNSVPLRSRIDDEASLKSLAQSLRTTLMDALDAQEFPFSRLVQEMHHSRTGGEAPLFRVFFVLQRFDQFKQVQSLLAGGPDAPPVTVAGLELTPFPLAQRGAQFDLSLQMVAHDDRVTGVFWYSADVFERATVEKLAREYAAFVERAAAQPDAALASLRSPAPEKAPPDAELEALLARLAAADAHLTVVDGRLKLDAPKGSIDKDLRDEIVAARDRLLVHLARPRDGAGKGLVRIARSERLPLSAAQRRLWFNARLHPQASTYNIGCGLKLKAPLDIDTLRSAIREVVRRHETLRMTVGERNGEPYARISLAEEVVADLPVTNVVSADEVTTRAETILRAPFDIAAGPLARFHLLRLTPEEHVLVVGVHHLVADGWSISILADDLLVIYEARLQSRPPLLREIAFGSVDYAAWETRQAEARRWDKQIEFWRGQLAGVPAVLDLPTDRPRTLATGAAGRRTPRYLDGDLVERLRACGRRHGTTLFMTMMAAWGTLLHRLSGQEDVLLGTPVTNREGLGLDGAVGCLVNSVPVRIGFADAPSFSDVLARTRQATLTALEHSTVPFDVLVAAINPDRGSGHAPIFQALFTSLNFPAPVARPSRLTTDMMVLDLAAARYDLSVEVAEMATGEHAGETLLLYEYATDLFDADTIERMHQHFRTLLAAVADDPSLPVKALPLLDAARQGKLLEQWNDTAAEHDRSLCAHQLVEAAAQRDGNGIAVIAGSDSLTYADLDRGANRLVRALAARGVVRGARVAICVDRTAQMPLAALAILKAGAAYVPLDPGHPADRLRYIIEDAGAACVVTTERLAGMFGTTPAVMLDRDLPEIERQSCAPVASGVTPEDLAYLIYTSGSTGRPKGVEVEHRNLVAFLDAMRRAPGLGQNDVVLAVTTLSFDIAGLELWLPLANGARVVIASREDVLDGARLSGLMTKHAVTLLQATPATWRLLIESGWSGKPDLTALCGGEAMPLALAQALLPRVAALWNMYGPTETTIWSTAGRVIDADGPINIGRPIANTRVYVLDGGGAIAPVGVVGELVIAGEGVARGYHDRVDLTARAFGTISIAGRDERIYRTGDLARLRKDGTLDYLGRRDQQVKIRGYRIELGEIEAVLATYPGVTGTVVAVKSLGPDDDRLIGYATLAPGAGLDAEAVRSMMRSRLPEYMVPAQVMAIPALPLTPNGKVDRTALPMPQPDATRRPETAVVPMTDSQRRLAGIWSAVLQTSHIGLTDNFFDLGGHSLLLVKLQAAIRTEFGKEMSLVDLFQHTTVASQAERLGSEARGTSDLIARAKARARRHMNG